VPAAALHTLQLRVQQSADTFSRPSRQRACWSHRGRTRATSTRQVWAANAWTAVAVDLVHDLFS